MNFLGIDYGEKRMGLAYGDDLGMASPLPPILVTDDSNTLAQLENIITQRSISELVVGYPINQDGSIGFKAREVDAFIEKLKAKISLPIHRVDETLTSFEARNRLNRKGKRRGQREDGKVDSAAAALILQDYLDVRFPA